MIVVVVVVFVCGLFNLTNAAPDLSPISTPAAADCTDSNCSCVIVGAGLVNVIVRVSSSTNSATNVTLDVVFTVVSDILIHRPINICNL